LFSPRTGFNFFFHPESIFVGVQNTVLIVWAGMVLSWFEYQSCPKAEFCFYRSSVAWGIVCERFQNRRSGPISRKSLNTDFSLISVIWLVFINIYWCPKRVKDLKSVSNFIQSGELLHEILWSVLKSILARLKVGWTTKMVIHETRNRKKTENFGNCTKMG